MTNPSLSGRGAAQRSGKVPTLSFPRAGLHIPSVTANDAAG